LPDLFGIQDERLTIRELLSIGGAAAEASRAGDKSMVAIDPQVIPMDRPSGNDRLLDDTFEDFADSARATMAASNS
jgi:hypothetical protein